MAFKKFATLFLAGTALAMSDMGSMPSMPGMSGSSDSPAVASQQQSTAYSSTPTTPDTQTSINTSTQISPPHISPTDQITPPPPSYTGPAAPYANSTAATDAGNVPTSTPGSGSSAATSGAVMSNMPDMSTMSTMTTSAAGYKTGGMTMPNSTAGLHPVSGGSTMNGVGIGLTSLALVLAAATLL